MSPKLRNPLVREAVSLVDAAMPTNLQQPAYPKSHNDGQV